MSERLVRVLALVLACGCQSSSSGTRLLVTFERASDAPAPEFLMVSWVGQGKVIADQRRVPAAGKLPAGVALGTFEIEVSQPDSWRTLVAHGMVNQVVVEEGAARVLAKAGVVTSVTVRLLAGRMPDTDGDGIPDPVDNCPLESNRAQGACQRLPDGGLSPDGGADGPRPDGGADGARADGAADGARLDGAGDARPPDAAPDARPPDVAPKLPAGSRCTMDSECQSGHCVGGVNKFCASANMVAVPAGTFTRGCNAGDPGCQREERPQRVVTLKGFEIDRTEVIQSEYQRCVTAARCAPPAGFNPAARGNYPVINLTWAAAEVYCGWAGKRLPTEAEWEKAARGPDDARLFPWGNDAANCMRAQFRDCGLADAVPVAALTGISSYGAEDMAGNAAEWVSDFYDSAYYSRAPASDPPGPQSGTSRVRRGGGYNADASQLRTTARAAATDSTAAGVRCARDI